MAEVDQVINAVNTSALLKRSLVEWRPILADECQVYVVGEQYLAKRFDQINFTFCDVSIAKEILIDNIYALLRYKYFPKLSDEAEERIQKIVKAFTINIKTSLKKVSFEDDADCDHVQFLEDGQVAFRNGVYDFRRDTWLFKYDIIALKGLKNNIYLYDPTHIIQWYFDFEFEPLPIKIQEMSLKEFVEMMKILDKENKNYCFELLYNICHGSKDEFNFKRFEHFCEILGYSCLQSFSQNFILLIGSGQNGKNSLFDGCFTNRLVPRPAANSLDDLENDRFITGSLENKAHNIFLETSAKTYTESKMIKALTGSMYQTIQNKGINKYSSIINCKYIFAGNDQDKIKFSDNTTGFKRRINIFEIYYHWDPSKRFLTKGDYYDTTFSDSLKELKCDISNTIMYIYFAMYGIMIATKNFESNFKFTENEWRMSYSDIDFDMKDSIENVTPDKIARYIKQSAKTYDEGHSAFFDMNKQKLHTSSTMRVIGYYNFEDMLNMFEDEEASITYFSGNDIYIAAKTLQAICCDYGPTRTFIQGLKKIYSLTSFEEIESKVCIKIRFINNKLKVLA